MELRKDFIKLSGGSLLRLPALSINMHYRSEDLPERSVIFMPYIIDFISRNLKLWLIACRRGSKGYEI
jgi:hypothetical protein